jgi:hypothetical protein
MDGMTGPSPAVDDANVLAVVHVVLFLAGCAAFWQPWPCVRV